MFFVLFMAIYLKVLVDTFCSGDAKDVECLKKTLLDLAGGAISWKAPFHKLYDGVAAPP